MNVDGLRYIRVAWIGVVAGSYVQGRWTLPRCEWKGGCQARPSFLVELLRNRGHGVGVEERYHVCQHHAELSANF